MQDVKNKVVNNDPASEIRFCSYSFFWLS